MYSEENDILGKLQRIILIEQGVTCCCLYPDNIDGKYARSREQMDASGVRDSSGCILHLRVFSNTPDDAEADVPGITRIDLPSSGIHLRYSLSLSLSWISFAPEEMKEHDFRPRYSEERNSNLSGKLPLTE